MKCPKCQFENESDAKRHYVNAIRLLNINSFLPSFMRVCELAMARMTALNNEKIPNLDLLLTYDDRNSLRRFSIQARIYLAEIMLYLNSTDTRDAVKCIQGAITTNRENGTFFELHRSLAVCAQIYKQSGERSKAKEALNEAIRVCRECGADGWVEKYEGLRDSL
ncbi:MAG: hypothetical protein U5R49_18075 [Deltaproteobacteria bacterium]|nr:hypothetical protein [Deltaproteobacteria bacterium]